MTEDDGFRILGAPVLGAIVPGSAAWDQWQHFSEVAHSLWLERQKLDNERLRLALTEARVRVDPN